MSLVSIIVPIYNVEQYLRECIDSIINQTYKNLEIILVDDGSPDNCGQICDEYAKKDDRIKVIHKQNGGLSSARNAGLDIATGEYISFIDSDDKISEKFIEYLYNLCGKYNTDISMCSLQRFNENVEFKHEGELDIKEEITIKSKKEMVMGMNGKESISSVVVCNKLYKKYIYETLRFPIGKIIEDQFTTYKAFDNCFTNIVVSNLSLYKYRVNPDSILGRKHNFKRIDIIEAFEQRINHYKNLKDYDLMNNTITGYQEVLKYASLNLFDEVNDRKDVKNDRKDIIKNIKHKLKDNYKKIIKPKKVSSKLIISFYTFFPRLYWLFIKGYNFVKSKIKKHRIYRFLENNINNFVLSFSNDIEKNMKNFIFSFSNDAEIDKYLKNNSIDAKKVDLDIWKWKEKYIKRDLKFYIYAENMLKIDVNRLKAIEYTKKELKNARFYVVTTEKIYEI